MDRIRYVVELDGDLVGEPYIDIGDAQQRAREIARERAEKRHRYAEGSLEWNLAGGWASPVLVRRRDQFGRLRTVSKHGGVKK